MTNLVLLSIQLVTNDVYKYQFKPGDSYLVITNLAGKELKWGPIETNFCTLEKKEVWQLYTIGYQVPDLKLPYGTTYIGPQTIIMLTLSNMIGTIEQKQETNLVFTPSK